MTCAQGLLRLLWGGRSWSATGLLTMLRAILYLSTLSHLLILSSLFPLHAKNWVYDVLIRFLRLTYMFATADHNIKMFSKIASFLQN